MCVLRGALLAVVALAIAVPRAMATGLLGDRVVNGGAEQGMAGWLGGGFGILAYDATTPRYGEDQGDPVFILGGTRLFGAPNDGAAIWQTVDFSDLAAEIDGGQQPFSLGGLLGGRGGQAGGARLVAQPVDGAGGARGPALVVGPPSDRDRRSRTAVVDCFLSATAPVGMRALIVTIQAVGHGLADNVSVTSRLAPRILPVFPPTIRPVDADGPGCPPRFEPIQAPAPRIGAVVTMTMERARASGSASTSSGCRRLRFRVDPKWRSRLAKFSVDARGKHFVRRPSAEIVIKAPRRRLRVRISARLKDGRTSTGTRSVAPC